MRLALLLLCLAIVLATADAPPAWAGEARTPGGHHVRWDPGLEGMARRVVDQMPAVVRRVAERLGFPFPGGPADVRIVSGLDRMRAEAGVQVPDWAAGVCVGSRSRIVLRADRLLDSGPVRALIPTLRHEWVHLAWSRRAGKRTRLLPLWAEEGLAEEIGGGITLDGGQKLDFAAAWGRLIPMRDIRERWPVDASDAALAYRQGQSWVQFFVAQQGWDRLRQVLVDLAEGKGASDSLAAGPPFDELIFTHTGSTLSHWLATWRVHLEETADPFFFLLLRDFTGTILFAIALIAAVAFFFLRRRRKRQIQELPDDPMPEGFPAHGEEV